VDTHIDQLLALTAHEALHRNTSCTGDDASHIITRNATVKHLELGATSCLRCIVAWDFRLELGDETVAKLRCSLKVAGPLRDLEFVLELLELSLEGLDVVQPLTL